MFSNRKLEIKLAKDVAPASAVPTQINIHDVNFKDIEVTVKKVVILVSVAVAAQRVVKTGCKIAEIYANK